MVRQMSEGMVARYKARATAVMVRNNMTEIRCPCKDCKLGTLIKPDSGTLEKHLLMGGFMRGYNDVVDEDVNNGAPAGNGDEESPGHDDHHDEGDAGHDHHDEGDAESDGGGEDTDTLTPLSSALRDPHFREVLLKGVTTT